MSLQMMSRQQIWSRL